MKRLLSFLSPYGLIRPARFWVQGMLAALLLFLGQSLSIGCHSMLHGCHLSGCLCELPPSLAALLGLCSLPALPATPAAIFFFDHPPCHCSEHSYILPFHEDCVGFEPWLMAGMVLGWVLAFIAAWRSTALCARRLRDAGKRRSLLLLPYIALMAALIDLDDSFGLISSLVMLAGLICLMTFYCRPSVGSRK